MLLTEICPIAHFASFSIGFMYFHFLRGHRVCEGCAVFLQDQSDFDHCRVFGLLCCLNLSQALLLGTFLLTV